ncbi:MAG: anti-sigma factor family protein [Acidimicrobiia bacterium]
MNHTEHEHDLIAGYASGHEAERVQAEALLASCPDCAADYREQLSVKGALGSVPAARLTATEAAALTAGVMSQMPPPVTGSVVDIGTARAQKPLSPIWGRMTAVAALLAGVVLVGTVITSGGGDSTAATTGAFETLAAEGSRDALTATTAALDATTAAAGEATGAATTFASDTARSDVDSVDAVAAEAERLMSQVDEDSSQTTSDATATTLAYAETCPELSALTVLASAEANLDDRPVVILIVENDTGRVAQAFYTDDCTEIDLAPTD